MDDGRIGHAELAIGGGVLYLADEYPEIGLKAPGPQATSVSLMLHVPDTDATLERARERGAQVQQEPYENYGVAQRHDRRPVRASLDAQRAGDRRRDARSSTATSATSRCGRPTPTAPPPSTVMCSGGRTIRRPIRSPTPRSTSGSSASPAPHAVLLLRGRRPRRRAAVDPGRRRHRRRTAGVRLRHACWMPPIRRARRSRVFQPAPGDSRAPRSTALGQANFRTSPTR